MTKKVVVLGPECTGKSELSAYLARVLDTVWVPEFARDYISDLERPYGAEDLPLIAEGQLALEDALYPKANGVLICDTDLYVIKVWSNFKYGQCDQRILDTIATRHYDLYLLTYIDVPWIYDPQREHPDQREELYDIYLREMKKQHVPFVEIRGSREHRNKTALDCVRNLLETKS